MAQFAVWHGDDAEMTALIEAVEHNCACSDQHAHSGHCGPHEMLAFDQRALDGLVFVRRMTQRLHDEEWRAEPARVSSL